jgi:hypothetical protein
MQELLRKRDEKLMEKTKFKKFYMKTLVMKPKDSQSSIVKLAVTEPKPYKLTTASRIKSKVKDMIS